MKKEEFANILKAMGIKQVCQGCGWEIDPTTCHCGEPIPGGHCNNHTPVPQGCTCHYADAEKRKNPDQPDIQINL